MRKRWVASTLYRECVCVFVICEWLGAVPYWHITSSRLTKCSWAAVCGCQGCRWETNSESCGLHICHEGSLGPGVTDRNGTTMTRAWAINISAANCTDDSCAPSIAELDFLSMLAGKTPCIRFNLIQVLSSPIKNKTNKSVKNLQDSCKTMLRWCEFCEYLKLFDAAVV